MDIKSILVTGANGMVGSYVNGVFSDMDITLTDIEGDCSRLNVRNPNEVM